MRRLFVLLLLALASPARAAEPPARQGPWNVILVVLDTVRADHASPYGYARDTTPALSELARRGVLFENALAQSDWTLPAFASIFTGRRPAQHGTFLPKDRLAETERTLAQHFSERGFATAAFSAGILEMPHFGLGRGFQTLEAFHRPGAMGSLDQTLPPALRWLEKRRGGPFFLLIHGGDAHYPYECPSQYLQRFSSGTVPRVDYMFLQAFNLSENADWRELSMDFVGRVQAVKDDPAAVARLRAAYDGCLSYEDSRLPALYQALDRLGLWDDTIVAVTADHGEALGEHGGYGHYQRPLYQEVAHVPLILRHPGLPAAAGRRVTVPTEEIDLLPTLLDLEGWPVPPGVQGRSLKPLLEGGFPPGQAPGWLAQAARRASGPKSLDLEAYREGDWKIVREDGRWRLFDLAADPAEGRDLLEREPRRFLRLAEGMLRLKTRP